MTDREKIIGLLRDAIHLDDGICRVITEKRAKEITDDLIANGVTFHRWIPVTERLPEIEAYTYSVDVMFCTFDGDIRIGYVNFESGRWKCRESRTSLASDYVTHWMPLPEPPKEDMHD